MDKIVNHFNDSVLKQIVKIIDDGGVVCIPTETVYALIADASNDKAVEKIYHIKRRAKKKPLSVLVGDVYQAKRIVHFTNAAEKLSMKFFPGPLTLVLKTIKENNLSSLINEDLGTVGIRMPRHVMSLKILKAIGRPVVGTSANISGVSGELSADPKHAISELQNEIDFIVDLGTTEYKQASTIVDLASEQPKIIRQGSIASEDIFSVIDN